MLSVVYLNEKSNYFKYRYIYIFIYRYYWLFIIRSYAMIRNKKNLRKYIMCLEND